jgi:hypothetical protein
MGGEYAVLQKWHASIGRSVVAKPSETINLDEIAVGLPSRIHEVTARQVAKAPDRIALVENGASLCGEAPPAQAAPLRRQQI